MENLYITKKCANCGKLTQVNSEEYKAKIAKGNWESSEYIKLNEFLYVNIDCCSNCGYCNTDIEIQPKQKFQINGKYQQLQENLQLLKNKSEAYTYLIGGYILITNNDLFNAAKAFIHYAKNCCIEFHTDKSKLTKQELQSYENIKETLKKVRNNAWETATTLASDCYSKTANFDALILLLYILKESEQEQQYNTLSELIFTLPLSAEQAELAQIITEQNQ